MAASDRAPPALGVTHAVYCTSSTPPTTQRSEPKITLPAAQIREKIECRPPTSHAVKPRGQAVAPTAASGRAAGAPGLATQHHEKYFNSDRKQYIVVVGTELAAIGLTSTVNTYCPFESFSK